jgi:hypothetical protein
VVRDPWESDVFQVFTPVTESRLFCHLTDAQFVGKDTMKEIQEAYLRSTTFMFSRNVSSLTKFRITDSFGLGLLPVELVLNLEMHIQMGEYKFVGMRRNNQRIWGWANPHRAPAEVLHNLELFFGFKAGTTLTINCDMFGVEINADKGPQQWLFDEVVPVLFPQCAGLALPAPRSRSDWATMISYSQPTITVVRWRSGVLSFFRYVSQLSYGYCTLII